MGGKLEKTHPLLSLTQTDLGLSFPKIFDAKRTPGCQRGTFLGETWPPFASVQMAWPPPPPALISHSRSPVSFPRCRQVKRGGYKLSFKQPQESGCRFRLSRGAYQSRSLKTVLGIVQLSRFTTFLSPD